MNKPLANVPDLLAAIANGSDDAVHELFPLVYDELHTMALHFMQQERRDHTLQPTALIHEAFLKLVNPQTRPDASQQQSLTTSQFENIEHFMATAAIVMQRILVNHAKARQAKKRGGEWNQIYVDEIAETFNNCPIDLLALDEALSKLEALDQQQHKLVQMRFFAGMTFSQCAKVLNISERNVYYEWAHARAWLQTELGE